MPDIIIAIDGLSSSGKSTLAKHLADELSYDYVDSGAFYRAVTQYFYDHDINLESIDNVIDALAEVDLKFEYEHKSKQSRMLVNNMDVEPVIRSILISNKVSEVSAIPQVRDFIIGRLKLYGEKKALVMDGRDIGTVVFPNAELKIYMTAQEKVRSDRRFNELKKKGMEVSHVEIKKNLSGRDLTDSTRLMAPLKKADDAVILDNTYMNEKEQFELVLLLAHRKINQR